MVESQLSKLMVESSNLFPRYFLKRINDPALNSVANSLTRKEV